MYYSVRELDCQLIMNAIIDVHTEPSRHRQNLIFELYVSAFLGIHGSVIELLYCLAVDDVKT